MLYHLLADLVVALHLAFVLFVVLGGLLVLRWNWLVGLHLPAVVWGALIEFAGWRCPLTPLEKWLRYRAGAGGYEGGFINHYIVPLIYPAGLTRGMQWVLGALVVAINLAVYWRLWSTRKRR